MTTIEQQISKRGKDLFVEEKKAQSKINKEKLRPVKWAKSRMTKSAHQAKKETDYATSIGAVAYAICLKGKIIKRGMARDDTDLARQVKLAKEFKGKLCTSADDEHGSLADAHLENMEHRDRAKEKARGLTVTTKTTKGLLS